MAFFAHPATKPWLSRKLKQRTQHKLEQQQFEQRLKTEKLAEHPLMGLPSDPAGDIDEAMLEIREEVEARRRRGSKVSMPTGVDMKVALETRLDKKLS